MGRECRRKHFSSDFQELSNVLWPCLDHVLPALKTPSPAASLPALTSVCKSGEAAKSTYWFYGRQGRGELPLPGSLCNSRAFPPPARTMHPMATMHPPKDVRTLGLN